MEEVTEILGRINAGDKMAADELLNIIYQQLRRLAAAKLNEENPNITLQVTELVSEAYLRLLGQGSPQTWHDRSHFFGAASEAMRRILVDHARRKQSLKRGGKAQRLQLDKSITPQSPFHNRRNVNSSYVLESMIMQPGFLNLWRHDNRKRPRHVSRRREFSLTRALHGESSESRHLLAVITVDTLTDEADGSISDGDISWTYC